MLVCLYVDRLLIGRYLFSFVFLRYKPVHAFCCYYAMVVCSGLFFCLEVISILRKQEQAANDTKEFLKASGLKSKYVAAKVGIDEQSFSKFINHRMALSERQLMLLETYKDEYRQLNGV